MCSTPSAVRITVNRPRDRFAYRCASSRKNEPYSPFSREIGHHTTVSSPPNIPDPSEAKLPIWSEHVVSPVTSPQDRFNQWPNQEKIRRVEAYVAEASKKCSRNPRDDTSNEGTYHCTSGCGVAVKRKDDFRRHEEIRYPQKFWICVLCPSSINEAFITHRQDKLVVHIDKSHHGHCTPRPKLLRASQVEHLANFPRTCAFCGSTFKTWFQRIQHIARHYETGTAMTGNPDTTLDRCIPSFGDNDTEKYHADAGHSSHHLQLPIRAKDHISSSDRIPSTQFSAAQSQHVVMSNCSGKSQSGRSLTALPPSTSFEISQAGAQGGLDSIPFFRASLHRSSGLCDPLSTKSGIASQWCDPHGQLTSGILFKTSENVDFASLSSHLDRIKRTAPEGSSGNPPVGEQPAQSEQSRQLGQPATEHLNQGSTSKRSRRTDDENSDAEDNGTPKKPKGRVPKRSDDTTYDCPVYKYEVLENIPPDERICRKGCIAKTISALRRHLGIHIDDLRRRLGNPRLTLEFCPHCNTVVVDELDWTATHQTDKCPKKEQVRGVENVVAQWKDLYQKIYRDATRIPNPRNASSGARPVGPQITSDTVPLPQDLAPELATPRQVPSGTGRPQQVAPGLEEDAPSQHVVQDAASNILALTGSQFPDTSAHGDTGIIPGINQDEDLALASFASEFVNSFTTEFLDLTRLCSQDQLVSFTERMRRYFHKELQEELKKKGVETANITQFAAPITGELVNYDFAVEYTDVTTRLLLAWEQELFTERMRGWMRCESEHVFGPSANANDQVPIPSRSTNLRQQVEAQREPLYDSTYGSQPVPTSHSGTSRELPQSDFIDPAWLGLL